ncbi:MAG: TonB family protein [Pseudomonadota bacterium]
MIRRSAAVAVTAIVLSLVLHFLGLTFTVRVENEPPTEEGSGDVVELGNAFEDLAEVQAEPVQPEPAQVPEPPVETPPDPPEETAAEPDVTDVETSRALVASENPQNVFAPDTGVAPVLRRDTAGQSDPVDADATAPETVEPVEGDGRDAADPAAMSPVDPSDAEERPEGQPDGAPDETADLAEAAPVEPDTAPAAAPDAQPDAEQLAALPVPVVPVPETSAIPVIPLKTDTVEPETPGSALEPVPDTSQSTESDAQADPSAAAVTSSLRPRLRQDRTAQAPLGVQNGSDWLSNSNRIIESPLTVYRRDGVDLIARGNAGRSAGRGFLDSRGPGNSDKTNYAGQVLVHLNRSQRVYASARGWARVLFQIDPDGSLAWVEVIDSAGSQEIDTAAKAQVQRAAPFPRPPSGGSRKLSFIYRNR